MNSLSRPVRKSWNFESAQSHALHDLLSTLLKPLGTSCMILVDPSAKSENPLLAVRAGRAADLATLPHAAELCHLYVKLRDQDIGILNDPSSGGVTLSDFTLTAGCSFESSGPEPDLLIAKRLSFPARVSAGGDPNEEGVRVPPMPIAKAGRLNTDILTAMSMHPFAPRGLEEEIRKAADELLAVIAKLKSSVRDPGSELRRANFKRYLSDCGRMLEDRFHRLPLGTTTVTSRLPTGEVLKLQLKVDDGDVTFDFAGTDGSAQVCLTDMQTFSACMAVTAACFPDGLPMNAATFSRVHVSAPARTLLSGKGPVGHLLSTSFVFAAVCDLVRSAFAQMAPGLRAAGGVTVAGHFQFEFHDGKFWAGHLTPGSPAHAEGPGLESYALWEPEVTGSLIEKLEREEPLKILACGIRPRSGGKGRHPGGDGSYVSFEILAPCRVRWLLGPMAQKIEGTEGGKSAYSGKVEFRRAGQSLFENLNATASEIEAAPGDQIHFFACGGGGYGAPAVDEAEETPAE